MATLVRDRLTWLTFAQLGTWGYFLYGFGPAVPLLRDEQGVSRGVSGLHGTAMATGTLLAGVVFAPLVARLGRAATMRLGLAGTVVGPVLFCSTPALPVTLTAALACGLFGSVLVNSSVSILTAHHGAAGPAASSEANAVAAGVGLLAPLALSGCVSLGFGWRPGLLLAPVAAGVTWVVSYRAPGHGRDAPTSVAVVESGPLPRRYWLAWAVLGFCISIEFCLTIWSSDVLRTHLGASSSVATLAVTMIVSGMFVGRLVGGRLALRFDTRRLLLGALAVTAAGFAVFWFATVVWLALAGLVLTGSGIALHFPLGMARAIEVSDGRPDLATSRVSLAVGLATGVGPFAVGALADRVGPHTAFLLLPGFIAAATVCLVLTGRPGGAVPTLPTFQYHV